MTETITVLLVDDDIDDRIIFTEVIEDISIPVKLEYAKDGIEAIEKLTSFTHLPEYVFLDLNMPKMGGKECLQTIKQNKDLANLRVIIYTTSQHSQDIKDVLDLGAFCFITKPSSIHELRYIFSKLLVALPEDLQMVLTDLNRTHKIFSYTL